MVPHLEANLALNAGEGGALEGGAVSCTAFAWGTDPRAAGLVAGGEGGGEGGDCGDGGGGGGGGSAEFGANAPFDFIVAADAIYLATQIEPLLASLDALARPRVEQCPRAVRAPVPGLSTPLARSARAAR